MEAKIRGEFRKTSDDRHGDVDGMVKMSNELRRKDHERMNHFSVMQISWRRTCYIGIRKR
jgi:hypothetical protein